MCPNYPFDVECLRLPPITVEKKSIFFFFSAGGVTVNFRVVALDPADLTPVNGGMTIFVRVGAVSKLYEYTEYICSVLNRG